MMELPRRHSNAFKTVVLFVVLALSVAAFILYKRAPSLAYLRVSFLSGNPEGNYYAIVDRLAGEAQHRRGRIKNLSSAGSIENINRLAAGQSTREVQFALVQDGLDWPEDRQLELIGRLGARESFVLRAGRLARAARGDRTAGQRHGARRAANPGATFGTESADFDAGHGRTDRDAGAG
jgi:hypothetical protein